MCSDPNVPKPTAGIVAPVNKLLCGIAAGSTGIPTPSMTVLILLLGDKQLPLTATIEEYAYIHSVSNLRFRKISATITIYKYMAPPTVSTVRVIRQLGKSPPNKPEQKSRILGWRGNARPQQSSLDSASGHVGNDPSHFFLRHGAYLAALARLFESQYQTLHRLSKPIPVLTAR